MYTLLLALTPAAFAAEPSFKDMKELEAVNGYMLYGSDYDDLDKAYIFVDGGKKDKKSLPSAWRPLIKPVRVLP
ncbi:hypothetical protein NEIELOOT_00478 [Neisseria elongata subsp. glycolytica ATCC 29315]|uniref:Uncharacterized protein n=1 Tax=Neisseria elongata subsp. glycolytica ATCC 29315 TaxID=546263 RepID=D4DN54_NEIEG|nr:hypothetical protein NEIELOOT_00478 [Neisseria elongata subsp. glycolytica ATCC 29315]